MATSYISGWNTYVGGHPLDVCETEAARRGWWAANAAEAACLVVDYLAATGQAADIAAFVDSLRQCSRPEPHMQSSTAQLEAKIDRQAREAAQARLDAAQFAQAVPA